MASTYTGKDFDESQAMVKIAAWRPGHLPSGKEPICSSTDDHLYTTGGCGMHDVSKTASISRVQVPLGRSKLKTAPSEGPYFDLASSTRLISGLLRQMKADDSFQYRVLAELQLMELLGHPLELITKLYAASMMGSPAHMLQPVVTTFSALQKVIMQGAQPDALLDYRASTISAEPSSIGQLPMLASSSTYEATPDGLSMLKSMGMLAAVTVLMATGIYPWGPIVVGLVRKQICKQRKGSAKAAAQKTMVKQSAQEYWVSPSEDASQKAIRQAKNRQQAMAMRQAGQGSIPGIPRVPTPCASPEGHQQVTLVIHPDGEACQLAVTGSAAGEAAGAKDDEGLEALQSIGRFALVVVMFTTGVIPWGYIAFKGAQKLAHILVPQSGLSRDASRWLEEAAFPSTLTEALQEPAQQLSSQTCMLGKEPKICELPTEAMRWLEEAGFPGSPAQASQQQVQQPLPEAPVAGSAQWEDKAEHPAQPTEAMRWLEEADFPPPTQEAGPMPVAGAATEENSTLEQPPRCEADRWLAELGEQGTSLAEVKELCKARNRKRRFYGLF